ncbi:unnamed protein product, partial [Rotaria magnacalcarata]
MTESPPKQTKIWKSTFKRSKWNDH